MRPSALLFDMDGTLTRPMLDFLAIKAEMGIGDRPILEAMAQLDAASRQKAQAILHRHEERAAAECALNPGCDEMMQWVHARGVPVAVVTRNSRRSAQLVLQRHGLNVEVLITRDDGMFKPDPRPLVLACEKLRADASHAWMIGDGRYDVEAGLAAGMKTVWLSHGRPRDFAAEPWRTVTDLCQLHNLVREFVS